MEVFKWVLFGLVMAVLFFGVFPTAIMSWFLYRALLVRRKKEEWARRCSMPSDPIQVELFETGMAWGKEHEACQKSLDMMNEGLHLYAEYFDFGSKKAVIILPGRMESCLYSLYFAEPYQRAGYNVLVIDNRAHGWSDGRYSSLGWNEHRDVMKWAELLRDEHGVESVVLHGCCIGAASAMFTATDPNCPEVVNAMIADGMFPTFRSSFVNHMVKDHHPVFPFTQWICLYVRLFTGADITNDGPVKRIRDLKKPLLMIHSREDIFSLPKDAQMMYDSCSADKKLVWFEHGAHSRIRYANTEVYDQTIIDFLNTLEA